MGVDEWRDARILVTGGAGFIGSHLAARLTAQGAEVCVLDDFSSGTWENLSELTQNVQVVEADICAIEWADFFATARFDLVLHFAANAYIPPSVESPTMDFEVNARATLAMLDALRHSAPDTKVIYASSGAVYGNPLRVPIGEDDITIPISPYGVSKLASERYVYVFSQLLGLQATSVRLFSTYGPRQQKQVVYDLIRKLQDDPENLDIIGDGTQCRDFTYVDDVVSAVLAIGRCAPFDGEVYNVATGKSWSIRQLAEEICAVMGLSPAFRFSGEVRPGDVQRWEVDIAKLKGLGFEPRVQLPQGLEKTVEWFIAAHAVEQR